MENVNKQIKMYPIDNKYMARCIQLACNGLGAVSPNPMVGAVIVSDGKIIGEGYHRKYGEPHAEVNAISSVKDPGLFCRSTLYVNLEPCSHYGKTPPCSELIIEKQISHVVIGTLDPFPEVSGRGVAMLRAAGIAVDVGVLEKESLEVNERFFFFHKYKSPYIILKWAQTADGFLDAKRTNPVVPPVLISSATTRRMVHKLRSEVDGIMVGRNTVYLDNPSLTVRHWVGEHPVRVVIDRYLRILPGSKLYDGTAHTLIFTLKEPSGSYPNVEFVRLDPKKNLLPQLKDELYKRNIQTLLLEGGRCMLDEFIREGVNEIRVETSDVSIGCGVPAPDLSGRHMKRIYKVGNSVMRYY